ncbi:flavodoxin family protein [Methanomassiliicoccus luminyensis]|jgi:multimeric flavodoxin WrbA|uniref:flavodoxin family protein n=1 Tax=Methanomassiliicoccus luminyensis TaxID=1080712 RepID=UPI0003674E01|nr:flavodoxin family protein [Methanomassiliicoccus luminyensis]
MAFVLGISGSPRRGGNTEMLLDAALDGAREAGAEVRKVVLSELRYSGCLSCGKCEADGSCPLEDDMRLLYPVLERADAIILASPIYFDGPSSQAKAFIDRGQAFWARKYLLNRCGKEKLGAFLSTAARLNTEFDCAERTVRTWYLTIDAKPFGSLTYPGFEEAGSIADHPSALNEARALGGKMAKAIE